MGATTSSADHMQLLGLTAVFLDRVNVPLLSQPSGVAAVLNDTSEMPAEVIQEISVSITDRAISIKRLLNVLETVRQAVECDDSKITADFFASFVARHRARG